MPPRGLARSRAPHSANPSRAVPPALAPSNTRDSAPAFQRSLCHGQHVSPLHARR
ncbi:hypothetical protein DB31_7967 [Hyalangium minutum]|uniref:Uncharacterized protein n=1 Tax=Hyalangium minutum TaxID=394096 RepID=A0A085WM17_9BACT|nr:hypothetical protein DB31_7967 [Hyalangium minutum]